MNSGSDKDIKSVVSLISLDLPPQRNAQQLLWGAANSFPSTKGSDYNYIYARLRGIRSLLHFTSTTTQLCGY